MVATPNTSVQEEEAHVDPKKEVTNLKVLGWEEMQRNARTTIVTLS